MTSLQDELNKAIEEQADKCFCAATTEYCRCDKAIEFGAQSMMPVIQLLIKQRDGWARGRDLLEVKDEECRINYENQEILDLIKGGNG